MGGYGSGRPGGKAKVESCCSLDVNLLSKAGCLRPGFEGGLEWSAGGEQVARIGLIATASQLILSYRASCNDGDWVSVEETVPLARSSCRFGGMRSFFVCPGEKDGRPCGRRVTKLYLGGRYFLCRHCYGLAYASQSEARPYRLQRRADKRKTALGGGPGSSSLLPKPKGMHWRTYNRYVDEIQAAEAQAFSAFLMGRRLGK